MRLKKVDFIWLVAGDDTSSIEWILHILDEVEHAQLEVDELRHFIEMKIYVTGAKRMGDLSAFAFVTTHELVHRKDRNAGLAGLRNPAIPGRPDWAALFRQIDANRSAALQRTKVFYTGPQVLSAPIADAAEQSGFLYRQLFF